MKPLRAMDALSDRIIRVSADARPSDIRTNPEAVRATHAAIFEEDRFRGILPLRDIAFSQPGRIFADLFDKFNQPPAVSAETALDELGEIFDNSSHDFLAVLEADGKYIGTITHQSLFRVLLQGTRDLRAENERQAAERFLGLLESAPDAMLIVDTAGEIVQANRAAEAMFRYEQNGLKRVSVESMIPENLRVRHVAYRKEYSQNPVNRAMGETLELIALRRDSSEFPVEISLTPLERRLGKSGRRGCS